MSDHSILRTKPVEDVLAQGGDEDDGHGGRSSGSALKRRLGPLDLIGFGIGIVIGTGIFTLTGIEARNNAGPGVVISFAIAGVVEPARRPLLRRAGLQRADRRQRLHLRVRHDGRDRSPGSSAGTCCWSSPSAPRWSPAAGPATSPNCSACRPRSSVRSATVNVGAVAIVLVLGVVAIVGIRESARVTNVLVVVKVAICVFVVVAGAFFVKAPTSPRSSRRRARRQGDERHQAAGRRRRCSGWSRRPSASPGCSPPRRWSSSPTPASRPWPTWARRPGSPRATCPWACSARWDSTVLYIGVSFVLIGMVPYTGSTGARRSPSAFERSALGWAAELVSIAAVAGLTSRSSWSTSWRWAGSASRWPATG